jgi:hypothetical protein
MFKKVSKLKLLWTTKLDSFWPDIKIAFKVEKNTKKFNLSAMQTLVGCFHFVQILEAI